MLEWTTHIGVDQFEGLGNSFDWNPYWPIFVLCLYADSAVVVGGRVSVAIVVVQEGFHSCRIDVC